MLPAALRRAASISPSGLGISSGEERRTCSELVQRVSSIAGALQSAGLEPGHRVATLATASPRSLELLIAIWRAGGVIVPLNTRLSVEALRYIVGHSGSVLLFSHESFQGSVTRLAQVLPSLTAFICLDDARYAEMVEHPPIDDLFGGLMRGCPATCCIHSRA